MLYFDVEAKKECKIIYVECKTSEKKKFNLTLLDINKTETDYFFRFDKNPWSIGNISIKIHFEDGRKSIKS